MSTAGQAAEPRRRPLALVGAVLAILLIVGGGWAFTVRDDSPLRTRGHRDVAHRAADHVQADCEQGADQAHHALRQAHHTATADQEAVGGYEVDEELQRYLRDVEDHTLRVVDRVDGFRALLQNIPTVNATLVGDRQNQETQRLTEASLAQSEEVKRISSWAAILFAPTLVGTIYGMNFDHMPELHWTLGYPFALVLMAVVCGGLYLVFKKRGWL